MGMLGWKGAGLVKSPRLQPSHSSTDTRIISSHPKVYSFFIIIIYYYYYFPKKILLEMPLCAVTQGYLHSITHLPLPQMWRENDTLGSEAQLDANPSLTSPRTNETLSGERL